MAKRMRIVSPKRCGEEPWPFPRLTSDVQPRLYLMWHVRHRALPAFDFRRNKPLELLCGS